jgi:hypothetical protein
MLLTARHGCRRIVQSTSVAAIAPAAASTAAAAATSASAAVTATALTASTPAASTAASAASLAAAATLTPATTLTATPTLAALAAATTCATYRTGQHRVRGRAETVIAGPAEGVEDSDDNEGNSNDQESIFSGVLSGLLSPEPFEGSQHGNL